MLTLTANDAKRNFGELLLNAQREPVKISKNSKDTVVVMSIRDYEEIEAMINENENMSTRRVRQRIAEHGVYVRLEWF